MLFTPTAPRCSLGTALLHAPEREKTSEGLGTSGLGRSRGASLEAEFDGQMVFVLFCVEIEAVFWKMPRWDLKMGQMSKGQVPTTFLPQEAVDLLREACELHEERWAAWYNSARALSLLLQAAWDQFWARGLGWFGHNVYV